MYMHITRRIQTPVVSQFPYDFSRAFVGHSFLPFSDAILIPAASFLFCCRRADEREDGAVGEAGRGRSSRRGAGASRGGVSHEDAEEIVCVCFAWLVLFMREVGTFSRIINSCTVVP